MLVLMSSCRLLITLRSFNWGRRRSAEDQALGGHAVQRALLAVLAGVRAWLKIRPGMGKSLHGSNPQHQPVLAP